MAKCGIYKSIDGSSGVVTDKDIVTIAGFEALFSTVGMAERTIIRTNATIAVRLNNLLNDSITIAANDYFECDWMRVSKIYLTAVSSAALSVVVAG